MARDREISCEFYVCEGECSKGKSGTFRHQCQICSDYKARAGGRPARLDLRNKKRERFNKDRRNWD